KRANENSRLPAITRLPEVEEVLAVREQHRREMARLVIFLVNRCNYGSLSRRFVHTKNSLRSSHQEKPVAPTPAHEPLSQFVVPRSSSADVHHSQKSALAKFRKTPECNLPAIRGPEHEG